MPGHLNETQKTDKRKKLLEEGIITQQDIDGNVAADALANQGADAHVKITDIVAEMHDKLQTTIKARPARFARTTASSLTDEASPPLRREWTESVAQSAALFLRGYERARGVHRRAGARGLQAARGLPSQTNDLRRFEAHAFIW